MMNIRARQKYHSINKEQIVKSIKYIYKTISNTHGIVAEWSNAGACKALQPWVQIPPIPSFCPNNFDHPKRPVYGLFVLVFQTTHIMKVQHIYTDGSCLGNPGPWWWAYLITDGDSIIVQNAGPISQTTNNQMELYACIQALQYIVDHGLHHSLWVCHTDSRYIQDWLTYLTRWKQYGWKTRNRQMVKIKCYGRLWIHYVNSVS